MSNITLKAQTQTWLKVSTDQSRTLSDKQKQPIAPGVVLPIAAYEIDTLHNHYKVTLGRDSNQHQVSFKGLNTWFVFCPAVQLLQDGQPIHPGSNGVRQISANGLRLLTSFEGLRLNAYDDGTGVWTIGYGTTSGVYPGQSITEAQAEAFLCRDLERFEKAVTDLVRVPLNDDQFSALVSFAYNVGEGNLADSTLLRLLNGQDYQGAADQFVRWDTAGGQVLQGLLRRRNAERSLFLSRDYTVYL